MKYCHECGTNLEEKEEQAPISKEGMNHKKSNLLKAAGTLALIAAVLCIFIGIAGIFLSQEYTCVGSYTYNCYPPYPTYDTYAYRLCPEKLITGIFGLFGLIFGIISGVSIYGRKMFSLALVGLGVLFVAAASSALLGLFAFIVLGLPILIIGTISTVFTCISRKEFFS